ncbi:MAG: hypothetical protein JSU96_05980, partial [Acidobacteriota bacterium]
MLERATGLCFGFLTLAAAQYAVRIAVFVAAMTMGAAGGGLQEEDPVNGEVYSTIPEEETHLYFPFYRLEEDRWTGFGVTNYSDEPANVTFTAYFPDGSKAAFPMNPSVFTLKPQEQIARMGLEVFGRPVSLPLDVWIDVTSDNDEIGAFFITGSSDHGEQEGGNASRYPSNWLFFTRIFQGPDAYFGQEASTRLNIANPSAENVSIELLLYQPGVQNQTVLRTIPKNGLLSETVDQLFGPATVRSGYVRAHIA